MNDASVINSNLSINSATPLAVSRTSETLPLEYWLSILEHNSAFSVNTLTKLDAIYMTMPHLLLTDAAKEQLMSRLHEQLGATSEDLDPDIYSFISDNFEDLLWK